MAFTIAPLFILLKAYMRIRQHFHYVEQQLFRNFAARKERRMLIVITLFALYLVNYLVYDVLICVRHNEAYPQFTIQ